MSAGIVSSAPEAQAARLTAAMMANHPYGTIAKFTSELDGRTVEVEGYVRAVGQWGNIAGMKPATVDNAERWVVIVTTFEQQNAGPGWPVTVVELAHVKATEVWPVIDMLSTGAYVIAAGFPPLIPAQE